ncbi:phage tail spike protein [Lactiplantibacillus pentosus]|uniref:phage tail spike protein n=1 Tax=Lactiplantibacillus pentosus TaxID=1589 RepID=UPI001C1FCC64|nr:phage tail spike protein [Lactiplantibacillus pentosus]MBU7503811.1 phage tail protein [Lactiplantibacillus pentosus]MDY1544766.1 phage tail spike protein [Lactiplantibacillus pentosus]
MALNNQYLILDPNLKRIGTLTVDGATKFYNDSIKIQLADSDTTSTGYDDDTNVGTKDSYTGTINLNAQSKKFDHQGSLDVLQGQPDSDKVVAGNNLAYYDALSGHWYVMHIYSTDDASSAAVKHTTTINFTNLCLFTLAHHYPVAMASSDTAIKTAFTSVFSDTGWTLDFQTTNTIVSLFSIDGKTKASTLLQTLIQTYDVEIDPYIEIDSQGNITKKVCVITDKLNADVVYNEAVFGKNMTSVKRTTVSTPVTKLIPYGANGSTIADANNGKTYIVDDDANQRYNPDWQSGLYYEAVVTANRIDNPEGLKSWAQDMLKLYNHPRTYYEVAVTPDFNPPLGATIRFKDELIKPVLDASGRVIQRTISFANPYGNTVGFGEYTTVQVATPAWLSGYQNAISNALAKAKADASSVKPVALTPDGNNFTDTTQTKRLILQAWEGSTNISSYIDSKGFIWRRHNPDGTVDTNYEQTGYLVQVPHNAVGTLSGTIETGYIQNDPEIKLDAANIKRVADFLPTNTNIGGVGRQYMCPLSNGTYIGSQKTIHGDTLYALHDSNFNVISAMTVVNGGHGASFDVEESDGTVYIWASTCVDSGNNLYAVSRFPYIPGAKLEPTDNRITHYCTIADCRYVNVDFVNGYVLCGFTNGRRDIIKLADIKNGNYNVQYSINIANYGFDLKKQTYQSQTLSFPYVIFHSGNMDMHDKRMMYAVNVVHGGQEFAVDELNDIDLGITDHNIEPETCHLMQNSNNELSLFLTFHCRPANDHTTKHQVTRVITIPIIVRAPSGTINNNTTNDNVNTNN